MKKSFKDIKNIADLRDHAIFTLKRLEAGEISVEEAGVSGKLYESVISSVKTELDYHKMLQRRPEIEFMEGASFNIIEGKRPMLESSAAVVNKKGKHISGN